MKRIMKIASPIKEINNKFELVVTQKGKRAAISGEEYLMYFRGSLKSHSKASRWVPYFPPHYIILK